MKRSPARIRLDPEIEDEVKTIAEATGLSQVEVIRQMVRAGAQAIKANGYKLTLPLKLEVSGQTTYPPLVPRHSEMNETRKKRGPA